MGRRFRGGRYLAFLGFLPGLWLGRDAHAQAQTPSAESCNAAFSEGPDRIKQGRLLDGRASLRRCAAPTCPTAMSALCADDLRRLESRIPTVVFSATDERGQDLMAVRVSEGARPLAERMDGRAVELDPGPHTFRFDRGSGLSTDVTLVVREGEKNRLVAAKFAAEAAPAAPEKARPIPWTVWLAGGLTVAAAGAFTSFAILGLEERSNLSSCKGMCQQSDVDTAWNHLRVADGFLAATIVGAACTSVLFVTRPKTDVTVAVGPGSLHVAGSF